MATVALAACQNSPLDTGPHYDYLQRTVLAYHRDMLGQTMPSGADPSTGADVEVFLRDRGRLAEADRTSGPGAYGAMNPAMGPDLLGNPDSPRQPVSLREMVMACMVSGLDAKIARIEPVIADAKVEQERAAFDPLAFMELSAGKAASLRPPGTFPGTGGQTDTTSLAGKAGVRQKFALGTVVEVSGDLTSTSQKPNQYLYDRWYESNLSLSMTQPLLRGAGREVVEASVDRAKVAARVEREKVRKTLIDLSADVGELYWQLAFYRDETAIRQRLVEDTRAMVKRMEPRLSHDVLGSDMAQIIARLSAREGDLTQARAGLRDVSDRMKRVLDDDRLPLASETVLVASEKPTIGPLSLDLARAVQTSMERRPDLAVALMAIEDADIRLAVAKNAREPLLDLKATVALHGLDQDAGPAVENTTHGDASDASVALRFEQLLGNREAKAQEAQERGGRQKAVLDYYRQARNVLLEVKIGMRRVLSVHEILVRATATRRAASESLRVAERRLAEGDRSEGFTTLIDRVLARQDELAKAEVDEAKARYDLLTAMARLDQAMGVSLSRFGLDEEPEASALSAKPALPGAKPGVKP